jgi:hypothetical protein
MRVPMLGLCCGLLACVEPTATQAGPGFTSAALTEGNGSVQIPFHGQGWGRVQFRQPVDGAAKISFITWVRELEPNTTYLLQQALVPGTEGECDTSRAEWRTIGSGSKPQAIDTGELGSAHLPLSRVLPRGLVGTTMDSRLRVIEERTGAVVLQSDCFQFQIIL